MQEYQDSTSLESIAVDWGTISLIFCTMTASLRGFLYQFSGLFKPLPIRLENRRRYLSQYLSFGLLLLTWAMIGEALEFIGNLGWF